jgi:hypothetical protein
MLMLLALPVPGRWRGGGGGPHRSPSSSSALLLYSILLGLVSPWCVTADDEAPPVHACF